MSFIDSDGRPARFLTRTQRGMKFLSADSRSTLTMSAGTRARALSVLVIGSPPYHWSPEDSTRSTVLPTI
jgi:hypothetical protein